MQQWFESKEPRTSQRNDKFLGWHEKFYNIANYSIYQFMQKCQTCNNSVIKSSFHSLNCFLPCWSPHNKLNHKRGEKRKRIRKMLDLSFHFLFFSSKNTRCDPIWDIWLTTYKSFTRCTTLNKEKAPNKIVHLS